MIVSELSALIQRTVLVPPDVLEECMAVVEKYKMASWEKGVGMTGKIYVVKFLQDGEIRRVSSDVMPEDGMAAFNEIKTVLGTAWSDYGQTDSDADAKGAEAELPEGSWRCPDCGNINEGQYCSEGGRKKPE